MGRREKLNPIKAHAAFSIKQAIRGNFFVGSQGNRIGHIRHLHLASHLMNSESHREVMRAPPAPNATPHTRISLRYTRRPGLYQIRGAGRKTNICQAGADRVF